MSATTSGRSTAPAGTLAGATRMLDYWATVYRRTWRASLISSFVTPLLYVVAMGVLLGGFIEADPAKLEGATSYLAFVAPGMLAAQAMTTVFGEVTYPVMGMIKWQRSFYGMIASPLGISDVVLSHLGFVTFRVGSVCGVRSCSPFPTVSGYGLRRSRPNSPRTSVRRYGQRCPDRRKA